MSLLFPEIDEIYFQKTREYFHEVMSSYENGNYRSAVVMLYSIAVCDLLFKLKELQDMYNDTIAKEIIDEVEKCRNEFDNKSKSRWEKDFVENVHKKTNLLDLEAYTNLNHLYDYRNFSAHPAINEEFELVSPTKEITIALIKQTLESVLVKPPIFAKKITDALSEDLKRKREIYLSDFDQLDNYLNNKYYSKMSVSMKNDVFKTFWKFCFILADDTDCKVNRTINRKAMEILVKPIEKEIQDFIRSNKRAFVNGDDLNCKIHLCLFLSQYPSFYDCLDSDVQFQIKSFVKSTDEAKAFSWFLCKDMKTHLDDLSKQKMKTIEDVSYKYLQEKCISCGEGYRFLEFALHYFENSTSYDMANKRFDQSIEPLLDVFDRDQVIRLIEIINENDQIYNRRYSAYDNTKLVKACKKKLGLDFDYSKYSRFQFDTDVLKEENTVSNSDGLPF